MATPKFTTGNPTLDALLQGTRMVESSGNYNATGPVTKSGDRAYGAYQVMGKNIPSWTQQALGVQMTPQEFLNNTEAQDLVARTQFAHNLMKYGNPQDAASVWFTGRPVAKAGNASDGYNTNSAYINKVLAAGGLDYNGRPGDTMALGRMANAANSQDPRSFVATADDSTPQIGGVTPQAQAINLTEENSHPLNNIGSTLANMGASIASLDRGGTGIASLNASKVASNLALQEAAREKELGWKYAGQTQNGQGMIFQNSKGQIRVEPLAEGYTGQKEPDSIRALRILQSDPSLITTKKEMAGGEAVTLSPEAISSAAKRVIGGEKGVLTRMSKGNAARIAEEVAAQTGDDPGQILANQNASMGKAAEARTIGTSVGKSAVSAGTFESGATNALEASKRVGRGEFVPFNQIDQLIKQKSSDPNVLDFKAAHETFVREYAKAINPNGNPTVSDMNHARELLSTATDEPAYERVVARLQNEVRQKQHNLEKLNGGQKTVREEGSAPPKTAPTFKYDANGNLIQQ